MYLTCSPIFTVSRGTFSNLLLIDTKSIPCSIFLSFVLYRQHPHNTSVIYSYILTHYPTHNIIMCGRLHLHDQTPHNSLCSSALIFLSTIFLTFCLNVCFTSLSCVYFCEIIFFSYFSISSGSLSFDSHCLFSASTF